MTAGRPRPEHFLRLLFLCWVLLFVPRPACASSVLLGSGSWSNHLLILFAPGQTLQYELRHNGTIMTGAGLLTAVIEATGGFAVTTPPHDESGNPILFAGQLAGWNGQGLFAHFYQYSFGVFINGFAAGTSSASANGSWTSYFNYQTAGPEGNFTSAAVGPSDRILSDGNYDAYVFTGSISSPGLAAWKMAQAISDLTGDADGDGLDNLMEYALQRNPHVSDAVGAVQTGRIEIDGTPYLRLTYRRPHDEWATAPEGADAAYDGVSYTVETSTDLATWQSGSNHVTQTVTPDSTGSMATVVARVPMDSPGRFLRLRVHLP